MARPPGIQLSPSDCTVVAMWRDTLPLLPGQGGGNAVLADALGVREQHISSCLTGRHRIGAPTLTALLRLMVEGGLSGAIYVDALRRDGSDEVKNILAVLRGKPRRAPRVVGRGRAEIVGGVG